MALTADQITRGNNFNSTAQRLQIGTLLSKIQGSSQSITSATPSTTRVVDSEVDLTPATTMAIAAGGSITPFRGAVTLSTGKTLTEGFIYGVQGKSIVNGTVAEGSAARVVGVLGQVDMASGTLTAGQVSGLWADIQMTSPTLTSHAELNALRVTNSGSSNVNALAFFYGKSDYLFQIGEPSASFVSTGAATPSGTMKKLKVSVGGTDLYILCAATFS